MHQVPWSQAPSSRKADVPLSRTLAYIPLHLAVDLCSLIIWQMCFLSFMSYSDKSSESSNCNCLVRSTGNSLWLVAGLWGGSEQEAVFQGLTCGIWNLWLVDSVSQLTWARYLRIASCCVCGIPHFIWALDLGTLKKYPSTKKDMDFYISLLLVQKRWHPLDIHLSSHKDVWWLKL